MYHAAARGCEANHVGIYTDYHLMNQAVSGRATSMYQSFGTLQEAEDFMKEHDVDEPKVIFFKDGQKYALSIERYRSEILETLPIPLAEPSVHDSKLDASPPLIDSVVIDNIINETIPLNPIEESELPSLSDDTSFESMLQETIKECERAVKSFEEPTSFVAERSHHEMEDMELSFTTSTPFRFAHTGYTQDIGHLSNISSGDKQTGETSDTMQPIQVNQDSYVQDKASTVESLDLNEAVLEDDSTGPTESESELATLKRQKKALLEEKDGLVKNAAELCEQVSSSVQVEIISNQQTDSMKSELANMKRQRKALIDEKDGLMRKNAGLRKANEILSLQNSKVTRLKNDLRKVERQKNHLAGENRRLQQLLDEANCLLAANVMTDEDSEDTCNIEASPANQQDTSISINDQQSPLNAPGGAIYYPPNLLRADLDAWLSTRMDNTASSSVRVPPSSSQPPAANRESSSSTSIGTSNDVQNHQSTRDDPVPMDPSSDIQSSTPDTVTANSSDDSSVGVPTNSREPPASVSENVVNLSDPEMNVWMTSELPFLDRSLEHENNSDEPILLSDPSLSPVKFRLNGDYPELSNLRHCRPTLSIYGEKFLSKDHAYQWKKALVHNRPRYAEKIRRAHSAKKAMFLGRRIETSEEWKKEIKFKVMRDVNEAALEQDVAFRSTLLSTGLRPLMEDTDHDTWGSLGRGANKLGELYEQLRYELRMNDPNSTQEFQERLNALRDGISYPDNAETTSPNDEGTQKIGLLFGDSNTQGVHIRADNYLFRTVPVPGGKVCPSPTESHRKPLCEYLGQAMSGDEKTVSLHCGTNDAAHCDPVQFKEGYAQLVDVAASKGAQVICSSIYHRADCRTASEVFSLNTKIDILNQQIEEVALSKGALYVDNNSDVGSSAMYPNTSVLTRPKYGPQYLHLNHTGRINLASRLGNVINSPRGPRESHQSEQSSAMNPEFAPWVSRTARRQHLRDEVEQARRWFQRTQQEYEEEQARRSTNFVPGASPQQNGSYPRDARNQRQW